VKFLVLPKSFTVDKPFYSNLAACNFDVFRKDLVEARIVETSFIVICIHKIVFLDCMSAKLYVATKVITEKQITCCDRSNALCSNILDCIHKIVFLMAH